MKASKYFASILMHNIHNGSAADMFIKKMKSRANEKDFEQLIDKWQKKTILHGKCVALRNYTDVDKKQYIQCLQSSEITAKSEGFISATQKQTRQTRNYLTSEGKSGARSKRRFCSYEIETVDN